MNGNQYWKSPEYCKTKIAYSSDFFVLKELNAAFLATLATNKIVVKFEGNP